MYLVGGLMFAKKQQGEPEYDMPYDMPFLDVGLMTGPQNSKIGWNSGDECILMQYTGLKDKNGKEIYEGDICKNGDYESDAHAYNYRIEEVVYNEKEASFSGWNFNEDGMTCEVIGNIYENPELLQ